ncbi:MAG: hypothetical protein ABIP90_12890 [Vicinamibacterales bacterium]
MSVFVIVMLLRTFLGVWNGPAASLGELAIREAVRRHAVSASMRLVTDKDLEPAPPRAPKPAAETGTGDASTPAQKPAEPTKPPKDEAWWRARMTAAREALDRDRLLLAALDNRVVTLTRDVVNRDDPAQRAQLIKERLRALEDLELMRKQVTADTEAIAAVEEDARREGVPPGWIRLD